MKSSEISIDMLSLFYEYWNGNTLNVLYVERGESQAGGNRLDKIYALRVYGKDAPEKPYKSIEVRGIGIYKKSFDDKTFKYTSQIDFYMGLHDFYVIYEIPPPNPSYQLISRGAASGLEYAIAYILESQIDFSHEQ